MAYWICDQMIVVKLLGYRIQNALRLYSASEITSKNALMRQLDFSIDFLLFLPFSTLLLSSFFLFLGLQLDRTILLSSIVLSLCFGVCRARFSFREVAFSVFLVVMMFIVARYLATPFLDVFLDSNGYHIPAISALGRGWNPYQIRDVCQWSSDYCYLGTELINHYPNGAWLYSAAFLTFFDTLDAVRSPNYLQLLLVFLVAITVFRSLGVKKHQVILLALTIALCPVAIYQLHTSYVDGLLASSLSIYTLLLLAWWRTGQSQWLWRAALLVPLIVNIKFTGGVYLVPISLGALLARLVQVGLPDTFRAFPVSALTAAILCAALIGINPYLHNTLDKGNPFYPAIKNGEIGNGLDRQASPEFLSMNRFSRLVVANLSQPSTESWKKPEWSYPISRWQWSSFTGPRFSGFGPVFGILACIGVLQLFLLRNLSWSIFIGAILASVFVTSEGWWPRLAPQLWLVPALTQAAFLISGFKSRMAEILCVLLLLNCSGYIYTTAAKQFKHARAYYTDVVEVERRGLKVLPFTPEKSVAIAVNLRINEDLGPTTVSEEECDWTYSNIIFVICESDYQPSKESQSIWFWRALFGRQVTKG
jgi:hypothetical protein